MEVIQDKDNFLTNRNEVKLIVESNDSPSYSEAKQIVAKQFNSDIENIVIKKIKGKFGRNTFLVSAFVYNSKEDKQEFEPKVEKEKEEAREQEEKEKQEKEEKSEDKQDGKKKENKGSAAKEEKKEETDKNEQKQEAEKEKSEDKNKQEKESKDKE